jgi:hypothetical protein
MLKRQRDEDRRALPKPVALTPEQVQEIAARTAAGLSVNDLGNMIKIGLILVLK